MLPGDRVISNLPEKNISEGVSTVLKCKSCAKTVVPYREIYGESSSSNCFNDWEIPHVSYISRAVVFFHSSCMFEYNAVLLARIVLPGRSRAEAKAIRVLLLLNNCKRPRPCEQILKNCSVRNARGETLHLSHSVLLPTLGNVSIIKYCNKGR